MAHYIDADKIRAEIEMRITDNTFGAKLELIDILAWLDTLESEKPMNQDELEEEINRLWESFADEMEGPHNLFDIYARLARHFAKWGAEHSDSSEIPNDLEEAAMNYIAPIENEDGLKVINFSGQDIKDAFIAGWKAKEESEKHVTDDLEEAAVDIADSLLAKPKDYALSAKADYWNGAHDGVIAGAKWQKQHDAELIEIAYNDGITIGMTKQKEQMLKNAVKGFVATHLTSEGTKVTVNSGYLPKEMCIKPGDKVRIIVCKKED